MTEDLIELTDDEIVDTLERSSQARLELPAREMIRRYQAGELDDPGLVTDLIILAQLLDESHPLHVPGSTNGTKAMDLSPSPH